MPQPFEQFGVTKAYADDPQALQNVLGFLPSRMDSIQFLGHGLFHEEHLGDISIATFSGLDVLNVMHRFFHTKH